MTTFRDFERSVTGGKGFNSELLEKVVEFFEDNYYELQRCVITKDSGAEYKLLIDPETGETLSEKLVRRPPEQSFRTKTVYTAEMIEDFDVIYSGYDYADITKGSGMIEALKNLPVNKSNLLDYLADNLRGLNTGVVKRSDLNSKFGKMCSRMIKDLKDEGLIRELSTDMSRTHFVFKTNPVVAYKGGSYDHLMNDWIRECAAYNDECIKALPLEERKHYQQYTAENIL